MSCDPVRPCGPGPAGLGLVPPAPGEPHLPRRLGDFDGFLRELIAVTERTPVAGEPLGRSWDVEGDPNARLLAGLWAYVAEGVAAYTELTAAEAYLGTAGDWDSLRRLAGLLGNRPRPRIAARGWVRADVEASAEPLVPAGTRVQAPGTPEREAQTFETESDARLRSEWNALTATWVPIAATPEEDSRSVRFLGDPGFRLGDRVLFVQELPALTDCGAPPGGWLYWTADLWQQYWAWLLCLWGLTPAAEPLAVASVVEREEELGTTLVAFDREVHRILPSATEAYAAYRIQATASSARRLEKVLRIPAAGGVEDLTLSYTPSSPIGSDSIVLDAAVDDLSQGQLVAIVNWSTPSCDIVRVRSHEVVRWEVAPGTPTRASKLTLDPEPGKTAIPSLSGDPVTVHVVDRRVVARHYRFPDEQPAAPPQRLRLYPAPAEVPERIAVELRSEGRRSWQVFTSAAAPASVQEAAAAARPDAPRGLIVDLDRPPEGDLADGAKAAASGNLVSVRHGATARAVLGSGDATRAGQHMTTPDSPIAYDLDAAGTPVPSQVLRVDGVEWREVPSLYGLGRAEEAFAARLGPEGEVTVGFGDGERGSRLPTGRNNVTATYRVGGGVAGEVESGAITSLLGSVNGVKRVEGAGPTSGGADQDDEGRLRALAAARARAFDRAISAPDLVDLALGYPGVSHATAWHGDGPPGCACAGGGLHLAFLRARGTDSRPPVQDEIDALAGFLDARRDESIPLCVCAATITEIAVGASLALDSRREEIEVLEAAKAALRDPYGPLAPLERVLGEALDRSDVHAVLHGVAGVVGVASLDLPGATGELGRRAAERFELITLAEPDIEAVTG